MKDSIIVVEDTLDRFKSSSLKSRAIEIVKKLGENGNCDLRHLEEQREGIPGQREYHRNRAQAVRRKNHQRRVRSVQKQCPVADTAENRRIPAERIRDHFKLP